MKKAVVILVALIMVLSFTACGDKSENSDANAFTLKISNNTGTELSDIGISWSQNGEVVGSRGMEHADKSPLKHGETWNFEFLPEDFPSDKLTDVTFSVFVGPVSGEDYMECGVITVPEVKFGEAYEFELSFEDGCYSLWQIFEDGVYAEMPKPEA